MKAIIPMAGAGTRLRPLTYSKPKALLHVGSKPIISHIIDCLIPLGCTELLLIVSDEGLHMPEFINKHYPEIMVKTILQKDRLGLGHAVSLARDNAAGDEVIVIYGDTIIDGDLSGIVMDGVDGVISVKEVEDPRRFGVVYVDKEIITRFIEKPDKPKSNLAIVGFNYFRKSDFLFECLEHIIKKGIKTKGEYQITDAFQLMVKRGMKLKPYSLESWFDCGTPQTLLETNRYMLVKQGNCSALPDSIVIPPVYISKNAVVKYSIIGPNVSVGENANIRRSVISDSIIGSKARIKNACLKSSLIGDNATVTEHQRKLFIGDDSSLNYDRR